MHATLKVQGIFETEQARREVEAAVARIEDVHIRSYMAHNPGSQESKAEDTDAYIVEIGGQDEHDIEKIERLVAKQGTSVPIYVTYRQGDMNTLRRLMRVGVKDVFPQPVNAHELSLELTRALSSKRDRLRQARGPRGGITAFLSAKGGSGATTLAVNVAHALQVKHQANVALLDLDIQFGNAAMSLDLMPKSTIIDALSYPDRIDPVFLKALMTRHQSGLEILGSPGDISPIDWITEYAVTQLLDSAVVDYDFIVLDIPRVFLPWTVAALRYAEPLMLVVQSSVSALRDAKLIMNKATSYGIDMGRIEVVNNRAMAKLHDVDVGDIKKTLHREKVHRIRNDYETASKASDVGEPVIDTKHRSVLSKDVIAMAGNLAETHKAKVK